MSSSAQRRPLANVDVYDLGHWETMQFSILLDHFTTIMKDDNDVLDQMEFTAMYGELDLTYLKSVQHIFASHGRVSIIRRNDGS